MIKKINAFLCIIFIIALPLFILSGCDINDDPKEDDKKDVVLTVLSPNEIYDFHTHYQEEYLQTDHMFINLMTKNDTKKGKPLDLVFSYKLDNVDSLNLTLEDSIEYKIILGKDSKLSDGAIIYQGEKTL